MTQAAVSTRFTNDPVLPMYEDCGAISLPINLEPGVTIVAGTVLGQITGTANDVQTFTVTGTPTSGTKTFTVTNPLDGTAHDLVIPYNSTAAGLQTLCDAIWGAGNTTAGGGAWPGTPLTITGAGALADVPIPIAVSKSSTLNAGATAAVAHTTVGRSDNTFAPYASGNSDGTEVGKCILQYTCTTDASGRIVFGSVTTGSTTANLGGFFGESRPDAPAWFAGVFDNAKLTGVDANLLGLAGWSLYKGDTSNPKVVRKV